MPDDTSMPMLICEPRTLPTHLRVAAAAEAIKENPANRPADAALGLLHVNGNANEPRPELLAVLTSKYWGAGGVDLSVGFMERVPADLAERILSHMNAWSAYGNCRFRLIADVGQADVRITLAGGGYWSYLGTDIRVIPRGQPTMSLQAFSMNTPESEYRRVVRHETGHTLGFPHEHLRKAIIDRLDARKVIRWGARVLGWDERTVREQILTPLEDSELLGTPGADENSIMCYQLPGEVTKDGAPVLGGMDLDSEDKAFVGKLYPLPGGPVNPGEDALTLDLKSSLSPGRYSLKRLGDVAQADDRMAGVLKALAPPPGLPADVDWSRFVILFLEALLEAYRKKA